MRALYQQGYGQQIITVLDADDTPVFFRVQRDSMLNYGAVVSAKIVKKNKVLRGYFAETEQKLSVFIPSQQSYQEGSSVRVQITKEARLGKDATGKIVPPSTPLGVPDIKTGLPDTIQSIEPDKDNRTDSLIEEALETHLLFAQGAELHIERTQSCWCLDIDSGHSPLALDEINQQACILIYKQIILKNLSGMILIDFAGFKTFEEQKKLVSTLKTLFKSDTRTTVYGFSKMRLFELKRTRTTAALADLFLTPRGEKHPAAVAYVLMRQIMECKKGKATLIANPALLRLLPENIYQYCSVKADSNKAIDVYEIKGE